MLVLFSMFQPQFMDLSILWFSLQEQMVTLSSLNQIVYTLQNLAKVSNIFF